MSKEQMIDYAFRNYWESNKLLSNPKWLKPVTYSNGNVGAEMYNMEEFINKCKTNPEFSEKWGLKIEERELTFKERCDIQIKNLDGMYSSEKDIFIRSSIDEIKLIKMNENNIPTKLITIKYNNETLESYE